MKILLSTFLVLFFFTSGYFAQSFIGIPFLDACRKMSKCDICNPKYEEVTKYFDSLEIVFNKKDHKGDQQSLALVELKVIESEIERYGEMYSVHMEQISPEKVIYGRLLLTKFKYLIEYIGEKDNKVYNINFTDYENYTSFSGVLEMSALIDEIIELNISESTNKYLKEMRMKYFNEAGVFYFIDPSQDLWYDQHDVTKISSSYKKKENNVFLAKQFLSDEESTGYVPFSSFNALSVGTAGAIGKGTWMGVEGSYEAVEYTQPFLLRHPISGSFHFRGSLIGLSYLWNINDRTKQDFLFHVLSWKHPLININLVQFGLHRGITDKEKWFYRPELGLSYGIFKASYSYNLTFDKAFRPNTEKHLFTFGISYPLVRLGAYY